MLNIKTLAQELEFEEEEVMLLLEIFTENIDLSLQNLEEAIQKRDFQTIYNETHSIKGCAGNLMLRDIVVAVETIEQYANRGKEADYVYLFENLVKKIKAVRYFTQCELVL